MKKFSKILSVALLVALVLSLGVANAFAANDGSITISNTTQDATYAVYKVFDATYSGDNVSYFYDGSNATFLAALQAEDSPFTLTGPVDGLYNVILKDGAEDQVIDFIKGQKENFGDAVASPVGNGGSVTASGLPYGYYYITSSLGAVVTIDSALKDVTVIDKNQKTTFDKQEQVEAGTWVYEGPFDESTTAPTASVGDTVKYQIVGTWTRYEGEEIVKTLKFHDVMSNGLTANQDVVISFNGTTLAATAYTVSYTQNATTGEWETNISIPVATIPAEGDPTFLYEVTNSYVITYSATINENAIVDGEEENTVDLKWTDKNDDDHDKGTDKTKVKDFDITLTKQDGSTKAKLAGAEFDLYDAATEGNQIPVVLVPQVVAQGETADPNYGTAASEVNNVYRHAKANETGVKMIVGKTGVIEVKGLANGNYFFDETKAPDGYNKLTARTEAVTITNADAEITVDNNSGTQLPSTGGIGTTIFYVVGGVLVLAAIILLVTKKRMSE